MAMLDFRKQNIELVNALSEGGKALVKGNSIPKLQERIKEFYNDYLTDNSFWGIKKLGNGASKKAFTGTEFLKWYHKKYKGVSYKFSHGLKREIILPLTADDIIIKIEMHMYDDADAWFRRKRNKYALQTMQEVKDYETIIKKDESIYKFFVPIFFGFVGKGKTDITKGQDAISVCLRCEETGCIDDLIAETNFTSKEIQSAMTECGIRGNDVWGHSSNGGIYVKNGQKIPCVLDFGL